MAMPFGKCLFHHYKLRLWTVITGYTPIKRYPLIGPACLFFILRNNIKFKARCVLYLMLYFQMILRKKNKSVPKW